MAPFFLQDLVHRLVVEIGVVIVHFFLVRPVVIHHIHRNPLAEIRFKAVHSHIHEGFQLLLIPPHRLRVGKVHNRHSRLPHIPLPNAAVLSHQQVVLLHPLLKQRRLLSDIRIDPHADLQAAVMQTPKHSFRIRKHLFIPLKIAPLKTFHPEAVEMKYMERDPPLLHSVNEMADCFFIIVCDK